MGGADVGPPAPTPVTAAPCPPRGPGTVRLVSCGVAANLAVGTLFAWSLPARDLMADVGAPPSAGPAVFAVALAVFTATLLAVARGLRSSGPRGLLGVAAVLSGAGLGLTAVGRSPLIPWIGIGLLFGAANGLAYGVSLSLVARVPGGRRGLASGLVVGAYAAGPVFLGLVAPRALAAAGWRTCLAVLAVAVVALLALAVALAPRERPGATAPGPGRAAVPRRTVVALWLLFAGGSAPALVVFATAAPLAASRGLGTEASGVAVSLLAAGNLAGRLAAGWWSDRVGRTAALATALAVPATALVGVSVTSAPAVVLVGLCAIGLAYGAVSALVPAATADRVGARAFPAVYGRVFTAWGCAGLAAPLLAEAVTGTGAPPPAMLLIATPLAVAALALRSLARGTGGSGTSATARSGADG